MHCIGTTRWILPYMMHNLLMHMFFACDTLLILFMTFKSGVFIALYFGIKSKLHEKQQVTSNEKKRIHVNCLKQQVSLFYFVWKVKVTSVQCSRTLSNEKITFWDKAKNIRAKLSKFILIFFVFGPFWHYSQHVLGFISKSYLQNI